MASQFPYQPPPLPQLGLPTAGGVPQSTPPPMGVNVGGILPIIGLKDLEAQQRREAELTQNQPLIQGIAGHIRQCWSDARLAKEEKVEQRMLQSVRQRRGEYDPDKLQKIKRQTGSEIYMMLTSVKCRGASSWLRDVLGGKGDTKPWTLQPTPVPSLSVDATNRVESKATTMTEQMMMASGGMPPDSIDMQRLVLMLSEEAQQAEYEMARTQAQRMERKMEDQLMEGGFRKAFDDFLDDLTTFPSAFIKGPVVRKKPAMKWAYPPLSGETPQLTTENALVLEWERVDPFMIYPSPASSGINDGYLIERHKMRRADLEALIGVEGYDEQAIREVLNEHGAGGLKEWLSVDSARLSAENKSHSAVQMNSESTIEALQFWGSVSGQMLLDWGLTAKEVPDKSKEYPCEAWLIGRWVIKASLNYHPLGEKPYYKASYEDIPGAFWGNSVADLVRDCQDMCNSAARALANNMGIASGPQVSVVSSRIPPGEDITQMFPWKIWQFQEDTMGGGQKPIEFFQPQSNAQELLGVYEKFSVLADEYSGIPRYMTGDSPAGGAGRTASGMSMLMNNANKSMKQVLSNIDHSIFVPLLERLYYYNMRYSDDPQLKGDVRIVASGASGVLAKENAQVRRNEFLVATANPIDMQIIGLQGRAALLRKAIEGLDIDPNLVVPSPEKIKLLQQIMQNQQANQPAQPPAPGHPPQEGGEQQGKPPGNGQELMNGAPVTDNFQPPPNP